MHLCKKAGAAAAALLAVGALTVSAALMEKSGTKAEPAAAEDVIIKDIAAAGDAAGIRVDAGEKSVTVQVDLPEEKNSALSILCLAPSYRENSERQDASDWKDFQQAICYLGQQNLDDQGSAQFEIPFTEKQAGLYTLSLGSAADTYLQTFALKTEEPPAATGDLDGDGDVTIADVMEACKILARKSSDQHPSQEELARGDMDGDQDITISDVMEICKVLARQA